MPALSDHRLRAVLLGALPGAQVITDLGHTKPIVVSVPNIGAIRIYLWTTTPDNSSHGRPAGEHKAQIILPGTARGSRQHLNLEGMPTALLGYSPLFGLFTAWDARLHVESGYSKNLQFKEETLEACLDSGWAVAELRQTRPVPELRLAVHPLHLPAYLAAMTEADDLNLFGEERREFFLARAPQVPGEEAQPDLQVEPAEARARVMSARLRRASAFGRLVLAEYDRSCAVCSTQLRIVEGAHIIPIHDARSRDEVWNGVSLCRNHHRLFDLRIIRLDSSATVRVIADDVDCLRSFGVLGGFDTTIQPFIDQVIRLPRFYDRDRILRNQFRDALDTMFHA